MVHLSKLVEVLLHIFDGGIDWQPSDKDLLCPGHQLAEEKKKKKKHRLPLITLEGGGGGGGVDACDKET